MQVSTLLQFKPLSRLYHGLLNSLAQKGQRPTGGDDPQQHIADATYNLDQLARLLFELGNSSNSADVRAGAQLAFMHHSLCRGDSLRLLHLADLCAPKQLKSIGALSILCMVVSWCRPQAAPAACLPARYFGKHSNCCTLFGNCCSILLSSTLV